MRKTIIGFDVSSSVIGWSVLEFDDITNEILYKDSGYHNVIKTGSLIQRLVHTRTAIQNILSTHNPNFIGIEQIVEFMKGKSTAKTVGILTTFNRMVALISFDFLQKEPEFFNVMSIRHALKLDKQFPKKEEMPNLVAHHLSIDFPYQKNKKGNIKTENYDRADGIAVALYYAFLLTGKKKKISK